MHQLSMYYVQYFLNVIQLIMPSKYVIIKAFNISFLDGMGCLL